MDMDMGTGRWFSAMANWVLEDYVVDAAYQGLAYYTMSCITNSPFKLARLASYYKGIQSAGTAVSSGMDAVLVRFLPYPQPPVESSSST